MLLRQEVKGLSTHDIKYNVAFMTLLKSENSEKKATFGLQSSNSSAMESSWFKAHFSTKNEQPSGATNTTLIIMECDLSNFYLCFAIKKSTKAEPKMASGLCFTASIFRLGSYVYYTNWIQDCIGHVWLLVKYAIWLLESFSQTTQMLVVYLFTLSANADRQRCGSGSSGIRKLLLCDRHAQLFTYIKPGAILKSLASQSFSKPTYDL